MKTIDQTTIFSMGYSSSFRGFVFRIFLYFFVYIVKSLISKIYSYSVWFCLEILSGSLIVDSSDVLVCLPLVVVNHFLQRDFQ